MEIDVQESIVRIIVLRLRGRIDAFSSADLRQKIDEMLAGGAVHFICDLGEIDFMDSAGLAALVSLLKRARQSGGDVKLVRPTSEAAKRILHLTKFDRVFDLFDSSDIALRSYVR